ncbi:MAG: sugar phosphate isomerase/epimerase [Bacteroidetes bacterium]|nr:sugar phosphate isomerase/epimerase [Bacteroidota bacterium]
MKTINRRKFIGQSAKGLGAALAFSQLPSDLFAAAAAAGKGIGFQTYPFRDTIGKDFKNVLKMMKGEGYQYLEMCSPPGYKDDGFAALASLKGTEMRRIINDAGLTCPSCHFTFTELKDKLDDRIAWAKDLGLKVMVCQSFWLPKTATLKDYRDACDTLNKIAEKIKKAGLQTAFHNHEMEFEKIDGVLIYDAMMEQFDPSLVTMQFQTEVINLGYKAADYFKKYPGRFVASHLSDWTTDKKEVAIGKGVIDWKEYFAAASTGGVKYFYVEMDPKVFKESASYIHGLMA